MEKSPEVFKSNQRYSKLPSCSFKVQYFEKIFNILKDINKDAISTVKSNLNKNPDQTKQEFDDLKEYISNLYKVEIHIFGSKGEYILADSASIFKEKNLPDHITKVIFDNSTLYKRNTEMEPQYKIRLEFDFSKPDIFDFITSPSIATDNNSYIQVIGNTETWVEGAYRKVVSSLEERKTKRGWLHQKNIYDVILIFFILPLTFWNTYKFQNYFGSFLSETSIIFQVAVYLYIFIFALFLFRTFFNYSRWVFSYLEIQTTLKNKSSLHRIFYVGLFLYIIYEYVTKIIVNVLRFIF